ncbi:four-carbon acid sugar kinase family protein [Thalassorhabdus alkalitolerans]|uniref:Four-carbon acid sugar kinase family protein n=1 Tax=Thalassorhabdus alkalitolerans TaxID=2282697 RepID=A0ABW0YQ30_9BACI
MSSKLDATQTLKALPQQLSKSIQQEWEELYRQFKHKIIVLDDDPTGVQTVHGVSVYTNWDLTSIENGFNEENQMFFILTNSRSFPVKETEDVHQTIAKRINHVSQKLGIPFLIISRGDSTMRGHYPLETETLRQSLEACSKDTAFDGEIIIPFFEQGGRWTIDNVHYVKQENTLIPVGETEFAKDPSFGFSSSDLTEYIEEKTDGLFSKEEAISIDLPLIRSGNTEAVKEKLMEATSFQKIIVNAVNEEDIRVFSIGLLKALFKQKQFLFRTGATFTKIIGNISSRPLLSSQELRDSSSKNGGLVVVGSHVRKTTEQLEQVKQLTSLAFIEFDCHLVFNREAFSEEQNRIRNEAEKAVEQGQTAVIYTRRELVNLEHSSADEKLAVSVKIADALTDVVKSFAVRPSFIIAKGGITSSDIGTNGLGVTKAIVAGQISPGVPVWTTDAGSKFPGLPYIIFPGNVGTKDTLKNIIEHLDTNDKNRQ